MNHRVLLVGGGDQGEGEGGEGVKERGPRRRKRERKKKTEEEGELEEEEEKEAKEREKGRRGREEREGKLHQISMLVRQMVTRWTKIIVTKHRNPRTVQGHCFCTRISSLPLTGS